MHVSYNEQILSIKLKCFSKLKLYHGIYIFFLQLWFFTTNSILLFFYITLQPELVNFVQKLSYLVWLYETDTSLDMQREEGQKQVDALETNFTDICLLLLQVPKCFGLIQTFCVGPKIDLCLEPIQNCPKDDFKQCKSPFGLAQKVLNRH